MRNNRWLTRFLCVAIFPIFLFSNYVSAQRVRPSSSSGNLPHSVSSPVSSPTVSSSHSSSNNANNPFGNTDSNYTDTSAAKGLIFVEEIPDSVLRSKVFLFHYVPHRVWTYQMWNPTLDPTGVQFNDPIDAINGNYYLGKGSLGQPHVAIYPNTDADLSIRILPDAYPAYSLRPENINFFQTLTPYSVLSYGSSLNKDYSLRAAHTRNLAPGLNASIDYRLFNPEGVYTSSGTTNHYLNLTTNYFSPDSRFQLLVGAIREALSIDENGGLSDDSYFTMQRQSNRAGVPVSLNNAGTVERSLSAFAHATYSLQHQSVAYRHRDSIALAVPADTAKQTLSRPDTIDVVDTIPLSKPRVFNPGVIGVELNTRSHKRVFVDSTQLVEYSASLFWTNDAYPYHRWRNPFKVTLGVSPRVVTAALEGDTMRMQSFLDPFASADIAIGTASLRLDADLRGAFNTEWPDSRFAAALIIPLGEDTALHSPLSTLHLSFTALSRTPELRLVHDALIAQNIELLPVDTRRFSLEWKMRELLNIQLSASNINHHAYCDSNLVVVQADSPFWLLQASLFASVHVGLFHFDCQQLFQHSTDQTQMPVPLWASKNSIYTDFLLFRRALRLQVGADIRYHTAFHAPSYDPTTGLFIHQTESLIGNYIWADLFVNLQVKHASIYLKAGHINALWETTPNYFLLPHYPGQRFGLFWGLTWQFFD